MKGKRLLIADPDSSTLECFHQALENEWILKSASSAAQALETLSTEPTEILVAALDLPGLVELDLFQKIRTQYPGTLRFIVALEADKERVLEQAVGTHQFIFKPLETASIKGIIERAMALDQWIANSKIRELVSRISSFPTIPSLYFEILSALRSPDASTEQIGAMIAKDMATMTKILQVLNSAYYALTRKITDPAEAVGLLGFEAVKSLVISIKLLSQNEKIKPIYYSIDRLWRHSTAVAHTSKQLTLMETGNQSMAETAYTAGLMHDLGKVVLASEFDAQYHGAQTLARKQGVPLWNVERMIFGASHGEIGAYLLGLWGMPLDLLEAAALHDHPTNHINKEFTPLTAVHIANVLEHELQPDKSGFVQPELDLTYLENLGLLNRVDDWREAITNRDFKRKKPQSYPQSRPAAQVPELLTEQPPPPIPASTREVDTPPRTDQEDLPPVPALKSLGYWPLAACGVTVVMLLAAWHYLPSLQVANLESADSSTHPIQSVSSPASINVPNESSEVLTREIEIKEPDSIPAPNSPSPLIAESPDSSISNSLVQVSQPGMATGTGNTETVPVKLQGILFSGQPAAIINGKTLHVGETLSGIRIVEIQRTFVIIEQSNQLMKLELPE